MGKKNELQNFAKMPIHLPHLQINTMGVKTLSKCFVKMNKWHDHPFGFSLPTIYRNHRTFNRKRTETKTE